jgi:hypothetical protein
MLRVEVAHSRLVCVCITDDARAVLSVRRLNAYDRVDPSVSRMTPSAFRLPTPVSSPSSLRDVHCFSVSSRVSRDASAFLMNPRSFCLPTSVSLPWHKCCLLARKTPHAGSRSLPSPDPDHIVAHPIVPRVAVTRFV